MGHAQTVQANTQAQANQVQGRFSQNVGIKAHAQAKVMHTPAQVVKTLQSLGLKEKGDYRAMYLPKGITSFVIYQDKGASDYRLGMRYGGGQYEFSARIDRNGHIKETEALDLSSGAKRTFSTKEGEALVANALRYCGPQYRNTPANAQKYLRSVLGESKSVEFKYTYRGGIPLGVVSHETYHVSRTSDGGVSLQFKSVQTGEKELVPQEKMPAFCPMSEEEWKLERQERIREVKKGLHKEVATWTMKFGGKAGFLNVLTVEGLDANGRRLRCWNRNQGGYHDPTGPTVMDNFADYLRSGDLKEIGRVK